MVPQVRDTAPLLLDTTSGMWFLRETENICLPGLSHFYLPLDFQNVTDDKAACPAAARRLPGPQLFFALCGGHWPDFVIRQAGLSLG